MNDTQSCEALVSKEMLEGTEFQKFTSQTIKNIFKYIVQTYTSDIFLYYIRATVFGN